MKRVFLYAAVIAAALAILALCFFSPSILAKQMDARKNDVQILTASPVSVPVPENETINRIGMLSGQYEIISATEFADGTVYTRDNAMTHARDLLLSFLGTSSQPVTQEFLETDPITKSEEHV